MATRSKVWSRLTSHARMRLAQRSRRLSETALLRLLDADQAATVGYGKGHMHWHRLVYAGDLEWLVAVQDIRDGYVITILNENEGRFQTIPTERKLTARLIQDPKPFSDVAPDIEWPEDLFDAGLDSLLRGLGLAAAEAVEVGANA